MNDDALLEKAAKAANIDHDGYMHGKGLALKSCQWWNPIDNGEDAMFLAIKLRIDVCFEKTHSVSAYTENDEWFHEYCDQGTTEQIFAKTRRCIVRAAASMAR